MSMNLLLREESQSPAASIRVSSKWAAQALTFLMVFGPGLIVMEADNDAGAVSTYVARQARNTARICSGSLLLLLPVSYFIQEMVVRLGIVTGKGHAAMIYQPLRQVVGAVLAGRPAAGQLSDPGDGVCGHQPGA
jgi:Mn2+/Fe2+ NRAMP family transporter